LGLDASGEHEHFDLEVGPLVTRLSQHAWLDRLCLTSGNGGSVVECPKDPQRDGAAVPFKGGGCALAETFVFLRFPGFLRPTPSSYLSSA